MFRISLPVLPETFIILKRTEWVMIKMYIYFFNFRNGKLLGFWVTDIKVCIKKLFGSTFLILMCVCPCIVAMRRQEKPTRCHCMLYCTYDTLDSRVVQHPSSWTHTLLPCTWPPTTSSQALHTIGGNSIHTYSLELLMMGIEVPETRWAYHKCNKAYSDI